ncbi:hypothetical protein ACNQVK_24725 [Mycobacterium sp. 134]|uniref:hypothetical protein n=1 Tax=Mycobacterium sp. 134 TaxID=3400425 RepID=UPI003AAE2ACE
MGFVARCLFGGITRRDNSAVSHRTVEYRRDRVEPTPEALAGWGYNRNNDLAAGECLYCHHEMTWQVETSAVSMGSSEDAPDGVSVEMTCACATQHRATPEGKVGCGRYWAVRVLAEGNEPPIVPETDPTRMHLANQVASNTPLVQEGKVRAAAEKWVGAVTALLGLFGLSGIAFGKDVFTGLGPCARVVLAVALALAVLLSALSVLLIYKAAYGWPRSVDISTGLSLSKWNLKRRMAAASAAANLRAGVYLVLVSLLALSVGAGAVFSSGFHSRAALVEVTRVDDSQICGELLSNTDNGALRIRRADGSLEVVKPDALAKIAVVAKCGKP